MTKKKSVTEKLIALKPELQDASLNIVELRRIVSAIEQLESLVAHDAAQVRPSLKGDYAVNAEREAEREKANALRHAAAKADADARDAAIRERDEAQRAAVAAKRARIGRA